MTFQPALRSALAARLFRPGSPEALALLREAWPLAVGREVARRTELQGVEGNVLRVAVPDAQWQKALHRMQADILSRLRAVAGSLAPTRLGFVSAASRPASPASADGAPVPAASSTTVRSAAAPADAPSCPAALIEEAEAISDPEIRALFVEAAARYLARARARS